MSDLYTRPLGGQPDKPASQTLAACLVVLLLMGATFGFGLLLGFLIWGTG